MPVRLGEPPEPEVRAQHQGTCVAQQKRRHQKQQRGQEQYRGPPRRPDRPVAHVKPVIRQHGEQGDEHPPHGHKHDAGVQEMPVQHLQKEKRSDAEVHGKGQHLGHEGHPALSVRSRSPPIDDRQDHRTQEHVDQHQMHKKCQQQKHL